MAGAVTVRVLLLGLFHFLSLSECLYLPFFSFFLSSFVTLCKVVTAIPHLLSCVAVIQALGEQLKVRQQVIATATVYFKRFYAR